MYHGWVGQHPEYRDWQGTRPLFLLPLGHPVAPPLLSIVDGLDS